MAVRAANGSRAANHVSRPANSARIAARARPKAINGTRDRGGSSPRNTGSQRVLNPHTAGTRNPHVASVTRRWSATCASAGPVLLIDTWRVAAKFITRVTRNPSVEPITISIHGSGLREVVVAPSAGDAGR